MKRQGYLYQNVCNIENIKLAILKAAKGKRNRVDVKRVLENIDFFAAELQDMLLNMSYTPSPGKEKVIYSVSAKKERQILIPQFYPDLCVQWALMNVLEPVLTKGMYNYSCGSVPGKGIHYAAKNMRRWISNDKKHTKYCLKMDITKFFPSVNLGILKNVFRKHIKDSRMLWLIDSIIDVQDKGLPIGFFTSPWFANFLLQDLDHLIKERLGVKYYIRYIDDMVLFGNNKKKLHKIRAIIEEYLASIGLELKGNWQVFRVDCRAVDFLGYRFFREHTLLRKRTALRMKRRIRKALKKPKITFKDAAAIVSYLGWTKHCDSYNFYQKNIKNIVDMNVIKGVIRNESRKRQAA